MRATLGGVLTLTSVLCASVAHGTLVLERQFGAPTQTALESFGHNLLTLPASGKTYVGTFDLFVAPGKIYEFETATGTPGKVFLAPAGTAAIDFGRALAADAGYLYVGAPGANGGDGVVYVYDLSAPSPVSPVSTITNQGTAGAGFGTSVLVQDGKIYVGAPNSFRTGQTTDEGAVFMLDQATEQLQASCYATLPASDADFGQALAIVDDPAGGTLVVGAPGYAGGLVFTFPLPLPTTSPCPTPSFMQQSSSNGSASPHRFGETLVPFPATVTGGVAGIAIGVPGDAEIEYRGVGGAFLWQHVGAPGDHTGETLGAMGANLLVGRYSPATEEVRVVNGATGQTFDTQTSPLQQIEFGFAVASSDTRLIVGAPVWSAAAGRVYVYVERCGNGQLDAGEACDDGNRTNGDCCSSVCQAASGGQPCTSSNLCVLSPTCQGGACLGTCAVGVDCSSPCVTGGKCGVTGSGDCLCMATTTSTTSSTSTTTSTTLPQTTPPIAVVAPFLTVTAGQATFLDGSASFDPDGNPIVGYQWTLVDQPPGASPTFVDTTTAFPVLTPDPDISGDYTITLTVDDAGPDASNVATIVVTAVSSSSISLAVAAPLAEATIEENSTVVVGTVSVTGATGVGVMVNGISASVVEPPSGPPSDFAADAVPLQVGANVLTITATAVGGQTLSVTRRVFSNGTAPALVLTPMIDSGLAPLETAFEYSLSAPTTIQTLTMEWGDGTPDLVSSDPAVGLSHTYTSVGIYTATLTITDIVGSQSVASTIVAAEDAASVDLMFQAIWTGMTTALTNGDKGTAQGFLTEGARDTYTAPFDTIVADAPTRMEAILATVDGFQPLAVTSTTATYALLTTEASAERVYIVTFLRGADGVWRLASM